MAIIVEIIKIAVNMKEDMIVVQVKPRQEMDIVNTTEKNVIIVLKGNELRMGVVVTIVAESVVFQFLPEAIALITLNIVRIAQREYPNIMNVVMDVPRNINADILTVQLRNYGEYCREHAKKCEFDSCSTRINNYSSDHCSEHPPQVQARLYKKKKDDLQTELNNRPNVNVQEYNNLVQERDN
ncbi:12687_t:CDS:2 [Funneliformis geosporum]|uniref:3478_t:CDS:1 n=1 Tax=Funneliformis geosporum TaxID=1117311 RepID=A0A9W4SRW2_9GLOM|nr:12687_t:CDS:2 [Funneliformis geosporum]CAI2178329.1 3478_t:CDS:2 [Funneliformis geosporum]